jgi:hypothetical protein
MHSVQQRRDIYMHKTIKQSIVFVVITTLMIMPLSSISFAQDQPQNQEITAEKMIFDFILVRPLGIVATAVGTCFFIVSLPFSLSGGNTKDAYQKMVVGPLKYTFKRPLGDL